MQSSAGSESSKQNIMASILNNIPADSGLTKIVYEGPRIALYAKNVEFIMNDAQIISKMVSILKKRIIIRTDESIRLPEKESTKILRQMIPIPNGIEEILFDDALGEVKVWLPSSILSSYNNEIGGEILKKTGWKPIIVRSPEIFTTTKEINGILKRGTEERAQFYKIVGEKIFRSKLSRAVEASIVALGGFGEVGRSCFLLVTDESKVLFDCGINPYSRDKTSSIPRFDILGLKMYDIDAVVVSHAHLDHTGFLPALFKYGYSGPVYCSDPTSHLMYILHKRYINASGPLALYSLNDIENMILHTIPLPYGSVTDISPDIKITLGNSGHIIGSSLVHIHIGNGDHNLVYTGDLKFGKTYTLDNAIWNFPRVETLLIEGTYGGRQDVFPHRDEADANLIGSLNDTITQKGKVLLPVPPVGLPQELIFTINQNMAIGRLKHSKILIEKVIAETTSVYESNIQYLSKDLQTVFSSTNENPLRPGNLEVIDSSSLDDEPSIILSPSSMLTGGPSVYYLKQICTSTINKVIFTSYQMPGTLGKNIQDALTRRIIEEDVYDLDLQIETINGLSSHNDYNQSLAYISRMKQKLRRVLINHGEKTRVQNLANSVNKIYKIQTQYPLVEESVRLI
ncbi:MAG TPA: beta-CASP ribonuclease aCPSF1 [Nitrososphaeraceae archaeon]